MLSIPVRDSDFFLCPMHARVTLISSPFIASILFLIFWGENVNSLLPGVPFVSFTFPYCCKLVRVNDVARRESRSFLVPKLAKL